MRPGTHHEPSSTPGEALNANPYAAQAHRVQQPDLDALAPRLTEYDMRRMNRKAIGLLVGIAALLAVVGSWLVSGTGDDTEIPTPSSEVVSVPEAPPAPPALAPNDATPVDEPIALKTYSSPPVSFPALIDPDHTPRAPSLVERRIAAAAGGVGTVANSPSKETQGFTLPPGIFGDQVKSSPSRIANNIAYTSAELPNVSSAAPLTHPDMLMLRGTSIRCVLQSRIVTDIPGFTSCIVTDPIYSFTGKHLLLPKGSKVMGKYEMEPNGPRVAVVWDRIVTPNGIDVNMASPGTDSLGGAGHPGMYSAHWGSRITAALLISLLGDAFKYEAALHGPTNTTMSNGVVTQTPFESDTARTLQDLADQAVKRQANRPATVTIHKGTVLAIHVARDVDFSGVIARR